MKLSLSGRIAENEHVKESALVDLSDLARVAARTGYQAVCLRPSQVSLETPTERLRDVRSILDRHGLGASMITPDARIARQGSAPDAGAILRAFEPVLEIARVVGTGLVRVAIKGEADIPWAQRAADAARERGIRLVHQTHTATPFETVADCRAMLARIDRPNFGITLEPANLALCGEEYGPAALRPLTGSVFNVYIQNLRPAPNGRETIMTNRGPVRYERLVIGDSGGVDLPRFVAALHALEYDGYVTTHQPSIDGIATEALAGRVYDALAPLAR
jgi:sugar phosphate isomerase/epimerase